MQFFAHRKHRQRYSCLKTGLEEGSIVSLREILPGALFWSGLWALGELPPLQLWDCCTMGRHAGLLWTHLRVDFTASQKIWEGTVSCSTHATKQLKVAEGTAALGITVLPKPSETNLQKPLTVGKGKHWKQIASGLLSYSLEAGFLWDKENCCGVQGLFLTSLYLWLTRDFSSDLQKEPSPLSGPRSLRLH